MCQRDTMKQARRALGGCMGGVGYTDLPLETICFHYDQFYPSHCVWFSVWCVTGLYTLQHSVTSEFINQQKNSMGKVWTCHCKKAACHKRQTDIWLMTTFTGGLSFTKEVPGQCHGAVMVLNHHGFVDKKCFLYKPKQKMNMNRDWGFQAPKRQKSP